MEAYQYVRLKTDDKVGIITLDNAPANALSQGMIQEIGKAVEELTESGDVYAIVIHGEGRFFAAGADIKEFTDVKHGDDFQTLGLDGQRIFRSIETGTIPVIAAIHGAALGGGLELAMACHLRVAATNAKLGLPELTLGLIPGFAGTQRLPRLIGQSKAMELLLTSDSISGEEGARLGLVNRAVEEENVLDEALALAHKIAAKSRLTVEYSMELLAIADREPLERGQEKEAVYFGNVFDKRDAKEGIQAFLEKRKPTFNKK
ncbi:enoyl-CoA hydratase [Paenalkalicoccus suaedae]|uniref:Enoyl-CoA hydratase n=1 Tax=Paenalkalicoccus suaedae TaxID=2592382 RepID=A0A859FFV4_9BACI|nr:enoyl-CoA hydratase [Paenalkalicoccus suaedae]QKS71987.1 enoyl-CoA hydratase [Paenalkalicoccus suaedae]